MWPAILCSLLSLEGMSFLFFFRGGAGALFEDMEMEMCVCMYVCMYVCVTCECVNDILGDVFPCFSFFFFSMRECC